MWTSPTRRGCVCSFQQERRETLQSCCSRASTLQKRQLWWQEGRGAGSQSSNPTADTVDPGSRQESLLPLTCHLAPPRDLHFLSGTRGLLPVQHPLRWRWLTSNHLPASAPAFKSRPLIWLFTQSSAPKQATGSSLQINAALQLPREGYIKYQSRVLFYNIITLAINP